VDTRHGIRRRWRRPADGDATELHFRHHGLTPELGCIEECTRGWDHFLGTSLREYVEVGRGSPLGSSADKARRAADGAITPKVTLGNHAAVRVSRAEKDRIRRFYRDVLGCALTRDGDLKDDFRMGDNFYIAFMYEDEGVALGESDFLKAIYLEVAADDVEEMRQNIVAFGVKVLEVPDPHLYFQAPGGQVFRLVGTSEDLSKYEGTEHGEQFVGEQFSVTGG
jgi:catechol 2,3-dioxygenase-like lactoylglutathione lyase family enzyme